MAGATVGPAIHVGDVQVYSHQLFISPPQVAFKNCNHHFKSLAHGVRPRQKLT
jgi:hypothetical protein